MIVRILILLLIITVITLMIKIIPIAITIMIKSYTTGNSNDDINVTIPNNVYNKMNTKSNNQ